MGNHVLANFGPNEGDARLAQAALRYYRCTEQVFIGNPRPMLSYFLANGRSSFSVYSGTDQELTYQWDVESWKKTAGTCTTAYAPGKSKFS